MRTDRDETDSPIAPKVFICRRSDFNHKGHGPSTRELCQSSYADDTDGNVPFTINAYESRLYGRGGQDTRVRALKARYGARFDEVSVGRSHDTLSEYGRRSHEYLLSLNCMPKRVIRTIGISACVT